MEFQKNYYPDFRSALNRVQTWMIEGVKVIDTNKINEFGWSYEDIYNLIVSSKDPVKNYQNISGEYQGKVDDIMSALGTEFIDWLIKNIEHYRTANVSARADGRWLSAAGSLDLSRHDRRAERHGRGRDARTG